MMKTIKFLSILFAASAVIVSCSKESGCPTDGSDAEKAKVMFSFTSDAAFELPTRALDNANLNIDAFRWDDDESDYVFYRSITNLSNAVLTNSKITGEAYLEAGKYKFYPSYGLLKGNNINNLVSAALTDIKLSGAGDFTHKANAAGLPDFYMQRKAAADVAEYDIQLNGAAQTVQAELTRPTGRVDIVFIPAKKDGANTVLDPAKDIIQNYEIDPATTVLKFTKANQLLSYDGLTVTDGDITVNHKIVAGDVVKGASTDLQATEKAYQLTNADLNSITTAKVMKGACYLKGSYLLPKEKDQGGNDVIKLNVSITHKGSNIPRVFDLQTPIPVSLNYVTIVRVYVLSPTIFETNVKFEVDVDQAWSGIDEMDPEEIN